MMSSNANMATEIAPRGSSQAPARAPWQAFSPDALPRLPAGAAKWTGALARARSRIPLAVTIAAKGAGDVEIRSDRVVVADEAVGNGAGFDDMDWFPLLRGGERGWVGVSHGVSLALVRAVLGGPPPTAIRPLASAERGVMAAILLSALDAYGVSRTIQLGLGDWGMRPDPAADRLMIGGSIGTRTGLGGRALVLIPFGWLADAAWTGPVAASAPASATLELARTELPGADFASAAVGDAVVFDGVACVQDPWSARLRVGDFVAPAGLADNGTLALLGWFTQVEEKSMASQDEKAPRIQEPPSSEVAKILASAPVEVVAEIGRLTLRGDELAGLMAGGVLSLGPRRTDAIQLRVGGEPWAVGELVCVGDELGVRILKLHAR